MNAQRIAEYTGFSQEQVESFLSRPAEETYRDQRYIQALYRLDRKYLRRTLGMVRDHYDRHLGDFAYRLESRYHIAPGNMSSFTLANWVIGFVDYPEYAADLIARHTHLPAVMFDDGLEDLLSILDGLPEGREQWQQAVCLLAFPLMKM